MRLALKRGDGLVVSSQLLGFDDKRLHFFHEMHHEATGELLSTTEQMLVHVDMAAAMSRPRPLPGPPLACTVKNETPSLPAAAAAPATVLGMS